MSNPRNLTKIGVVVGALLIVLARSSALAASKEFAGTVLNVASDPKGELHTLAEKLIPEFEKETGMKVNIFHMVFEILKTRELLDFRTKKGEYDIFAMDGLWLGEYSEAGVMLPLDDLIARDSEEVLYDDFTPAARGMVEWNGKIWALPIMVQYWVMVYRRDLLGDAGIVPPETWDEFSTAVKKLYYPEKEQYGWTTCGKRGIALVHNWFPFFAGFGGRVFEDMPRDYTPLMDGPIAKKVLEYWKELVPYGPPGLVSYDWPDCIESWLMGYAALWPIYCNLVHFAEDPKASKIVGLTGSTSQPHDPAYPQSEMVPYGGWTWGINPIGKNKEAAWELIKWVTSPKVSTEWMRLDTLPFRFSHLRKLEFQERLSYFQPMLERELKGEVNGTYRPQIAAWSTIEDIMGEELSAALTDMKTVDKALHDANERIKTYMKEHDYPMGG